MNEEEKWKRVEPIKSDVIKVIMLRLPKSLKEAIDQKAWGQKKSVNLFITELLKKELANDQPTTATN